LIDVIEDIGLWWSDYWPNVVFVAALIALAVSVYMAITTYEAEKSAFMDECLQHRENYECVAMWRGGNSNVVPVPVVIPVR
jgi:hypothetical protein